MSIVRRWWVLIRRFIQSNYFSRGFVFVSLVLVAGASWYLLDQVTPKTEVIPTSVHSPDYYLENFVSTSMDVDGSLKSRIQGDRMIHFIDEDSTEITNPVMTVFDGEKPPWVIVSESGWMSGDGELLMLLGEVKMDRAGLKRIGMNDIKPMHIDTHDLRVLPKDDWAETEHEVFITSVNDRVQGVGMRTLFSTPIRFQLLSKVRSFYAHEK